MALRINLLSLFVYLQTRGFPAYSGSRVCVCVVQKQLFFSFSFSFSFNIPLLLVPNAHVYLLPSFPLADTNFVRGKRNKSLLTNIYIIYPHHLFKKLAIYGNNCCYCCCHRHRCRHATCMNRQVTVPRRNMQELEKKTHTHTQ